MDSHSSVESTTYNGIPSSQIRPVFKAACSLRYSNPQVGNIVTMTKTTLEAPIVSTIIEGARRLVHPKEDPDGGAARKEKQRARAERALQAEEDFVKIIRAFQKLMMDEKQQRQTIQNAINNGNTNATKITPDIRFLNPTIVNGILCHWIEYKATFGFKDDPFVHRQNCKQYRKYVTAFGSGMVVYKLGYQTELLRMEGVACFRETEVIEWINRQVSNESTV